MLHGHDELRSLFAMLAERKPPMRQYYRTPYLTDMGEQVNFAEAMELNDEGLIQWHHVYWGWFGFRVLQRNEYHR